MKKILLLCAGGMSTSIIVNKMKEVAKEKNIEVEILADGVDKFENHLSNFDVFLLGPQIRFKEKALQEKADKEGKKVSVIDMLDYGRMNGEKILDTALSLIK